MVTAVDFTRTYKSKHHTMHHLETRQLGYLTLGIVLALALSVGFATLAAADSATSTTGTTTVSYVFDAELSGANEVPPIVATSSTTTGGMGTTSATTTGHARIWFDMTNATGSATTTVSMWKLIHVWNGNDVTMAHLHCGLPGANGPVVADLFMSNATSGVDVNGTLVGTSSVVQSDIHATTTGCSMPISNLYDLANAMKAGIIYANVHSVQFPAGVARGQMALTSQSSTSTSTSTPPMGTSTPPTGTTTPPVVSPGLGSSISSFVQSLLHSGDPTDVGRKVTEFIRGLRLSR